MSDADITSKERLGEYTQSEGFKRLSPDAQDLMLLLIERFPDFLFGQSVQYDAHGKADLEKPSIVSAHFCKEDIPNFGMKTPPSLVESINQTVEAFAKERGIDVSDVFRSQTFAKNDIELHTDVLPQQHAGVIDHGEDRTHDR